MPSKTVPNLVCPGCGGAVGPEGKGQAAVTIVADGVVTSSTYCPGCSNLVLSENLQQLIQGKLRKGVALSYEEIKRLRLLEPTGNMGASPDLKGDLMATKTVPNRACPGCGGALAEPRREAQVSVLIRMGDLEAGSSSAWCVKCSSQIATIDANKLLEKVNLSIRGEIGRRIPLSEDLVREIAGNLGASPKLQDALVERIFGANWDGVVPEGAVMNSLANRDRLVAFVVTKLKDLWTLEA